MTDILPDDRCLAFHPLYFHAEGTEVTVARIDQGSFLVLPEEGAALLRRLMNGATVAQAGAWFLATYGEPVDTAEFIEGLSEFGFLRGEGEPPMQAPAIRWVRLGRAVFSTVSAVAFASLVIAAIVVMARSPDMVPNYRNMFFTHYMSVIAVSLYLVQMPLVLLHECAHALAGRRLGLRSRLSIGRRLYFVVFQTTMDGLIAVPRRQRVLPILAGALTDVGVICVLTVIAAATRRPDGSLPGISAFLLALAFTTMLRLAWQGWFFLETDLYHLIVVALGCVDLQATARQVLADRVRRGLGRPRRHDPESWHPRDYAVARWYSWLIVLGYGVVIALLVSNTAPAVVRVFTTVVSRLNGHGPQGGAGLADSIVFLMLSVGELSLAAVLYTRERRRARQARSIPAAMPAAS